MWIFRICAMIVLALGLAACSGKTKFLNYDGPEITSIQVHKGDRKMYMITNGRIYKTYDIQLGGNPVGHKQFEGDRKTPEGTYHIDRRNPNSRFHLSLGVSYPNAQDRAFAISQGKSAGGDIMIHGLPPRAKVLPKDWTEGCIAVSNKEIEEIYAMIKDYTVIHIMP